MRELYDTALSNLINGNITDYKSSIGGLDREDLVGFIIYATALGYDMNDIKMTSYNEWMYL
ncbi:hypothetical protein CMI37_27525 [Candidatus Pacearchaeota archaeon]|jgi:hypothetical protein|nr:hypothetical protein [Candidatus Pacearchaeota archaeon]